MAALTEDQLLALARTHLHSGIETLNSRHMDDLDFYDVAVWGIRDALVAAYEAALVPCTGGCGLTVGQCVKPHHCGALTR